MKYDLYAMADICADVLLFVCADIPLPVSSAVCKHWRKVLLSDQMKYIRKRLSTTTISEIIQLPILFYNDLTMTQQLLLPNELFGTVFVIADIHKYDLYKFQISWADVRDSEYMRLILNKYDCYGKVVFPVSSSDYYKHLFEHSIQYRHYMTMVVGAGINDNILKSMGRGTKLDTQSAKLSYLANCVWKYNRKHIKHWNGIVSIDYNHVKNKFSPCKPASKCGKKEVSALGW